MTKIQNQLNQQWEDSRNKILETTINSLNEVTLREKNRKLNQFTTAELEQELLNRQKCHFGRLTCTEKAQDYLIKPFNYQKNPTCFNCKQDTLSLLKGKK